MLLRHCGIGVRRYSPALTGFLAVHDRYRPPSIGPAVDRAALAYSPLVVCTGATGAAGGIGANRSRPG
jgi:hypothetical protein